MSFPSSQDEGFMELLGHRNMSVIPKDQRALLDTDECWAVRLGTEGDLQARVPAHVMKSVGDAYHRAQHKKQLRTSRSRSHSSSEESEPDDVQETASQAPPPSSPPPAREDIESSPGTPLSWEASPERQSSKAENQSPTIHQTPPAQSPERPASQPRYTSHTPVQTQPPPSSYQEEELEVEVPQGHNSRHISPGRDSLGTQRFLAHHNQSLSTPTCAQPDERTIPATVAPKGPGSPTTPSPVPKPKMRRMKPIKFSDSPEIQRRTEPATVERMPSTKNFVDVESSNVTSSSYIPATFDEPAVYRKTSAMEKVYEMEDSDEEDGKDVQSQPDVTIVHSPQPEVDSPMSNTDEPRKENDTKLPEEETVLIKDTTPVIDLLEDPFAAFSAHYPDYTTQHGGNVSHFIRACICLDYMRENRLLRDILYDDFIRAWSSEFWSYAHTEPEPLPAAQWYNNITGDYLYGKWLVKHDNLDKILAIYNGEVSKIRPLIETPEKKAESRSKKQEGAERESSIEAVVTSHSEAMDVDKSGEESTSTPQRVKLPSEAEVHTPVASPAKAQASKPPITKSRLASTSSERRGSSSPKPASHTPIRRAPSSAASSASKSRAPSASAHPYLQRLASRSSSSAARSKTDDKRKKLQEHFRKRNSAGSSTGAAGTRS